MGNYSCFAKESRRPCSKSVEQLLASETVLPEFRDGLRVLAQHIETCQAAKLTEIWMEHSDEHLLIITKFASELNFWIKTNYGQELVILSMCQVPLVRAGDSSLDFSCHYHRLVFSAPPQSSASAAQVVVSAAAVCL